MNGFLLDENLPSRFRFRPSKSVLHARNIGQHLTDERIWNYAKANRFVIVTKDGDFADRMLTSVPPPWVIHFRFGNLRRADFHQYVERIWPRLEILLASNKMLNVYLDRIEAVS